VGLLDGGVTGFRKGLGLLLGMVGEGSLGAHGRVHGERELGLGLVLLILRVEASPEHLAEKGITKANESHGNPGKSRVEK